MHIWLHNPKFFPSFLILFSLSLFKFLYVFYFLVLFFFSFCLFSFAVFCTLGRLFLPLWHIYCKPFMLAYTQIVISAVTLMLIFCCLFFLSLLSVSTLAITIPHFNWEQPEQPCRCEVILRWNLKEIATLVAHTLGWHIAVGDLMGASSLLVEILSAASIHFLFQICVTICCKR